MVETRWPELDGSVIRYADRQWELTGEVSIPGTGEQIEAEATQVDDVRRGRAAFRFGLESPPASVNPGAMGDHFQELVRDGDRHILVVSNQSGTYRYELLGMTPE